MPSPCAPAIRIRLGWSQLALLDRAREDTLDEVAL
jgi:hypothetical protein